MTVFTAFRIQAFKGFAAQISTPKSHSKAISSVEDRLEHRKHRKLPLKMRTVEDSHLLTYRYFEIVQNLLSRMTCSRLP